MLQQVRGTGRRKRARAQVRIIPGTGRIVVNGWDFRQYFRLETLQNLVTKPLSLASGIREIDVIVKVEGGGISGQAGAVALGISRALLLFDPTLRPILRQNGLLTRDPREKERKKYGRRRARRAFQFSKR
ncbi:MAG: 30S ribosomal protein S9 [bacterium JZ-2024 1]